MRVTHWLAGMAIGVLVGVTGVLRAAPAGTRPAAVDVDYVPPVGEAPARRLAGGSRNCGWLKTHLVLLAPSGHVGRTVSERPVLYWYLSEATSKPIEIALTPFDPAAPSKKSAPVVDVVLKGPHAAGIHRFDVAALKDAPAAKLEAGRQYDWVIEVIAQEANASANPVAATRLECVAVPEGLAEKLTKATPLQRAAALAKAGLWYDAVAALTGAIDAQETDPASAATLRAARQHLLKGQGIVEADDGGMQDVAGK